MPSDFIIYWRSVTQPLRTHSGSCPSPRPVVGSTNEGLGQILVNICLLFLIVSFQRTGFSIFVAFLARSTLLRILDIWRHWRAYKLHHPGSTARTTMYSVFEKFIISTEFSAVRSIPPNKPFFTRKPPDHQWKIARAGAMNGPLSLNWWYPVSWFPVFTPYT